MFRSEGSFRSSISLPRLAHSSDPPYPTLPLLLPSPSHAVPDPPWAAGAVFGLGGALAVFYYRHREILGKHSDVMLQQLRNTLIINLMFGLLSRNIDNWYAGPSGSLRAPLLPFPLPPKLVDSRHATDPDADCRGHIGGLLGGAAVAWLLGPNLVEERQLGGKKARLVDRPPVPIFAYRRPAGSS